MGARRESADTGAPKPKKTDRRTLYTRSVVKDAFLELVAEVGYDKVTVTAVCKRAEITRATFYLHYKNVAEVLDAVMDDALHMDVGEREPAQIVDDLRREAGVLDSVAYLPTCQRVSANEKYRPLFLDRSLSTYIVDRLFRVESERRIPDIMQSTGLTRAQAERLLLFVIHGSFALNNSFGWQRSREWREMQDVLNRFTEGGFASLGER